SVTKKNPSAVSVKGSTRSRPPSPVRWMSPASLTTSLPLPGSRARPEEAPKAIAPVSSTTPTTAPLAVSRTTTRLRPAGTSRRVRRFEHVEVVAEEAVHDVDPLARHAHDCVRVDGRGRVRDPVRRPHADRGEEAGLEVGGDDHGARRVRAHAAEAQPAALRAARGR